MATSEPQPHLVALGGDSDIERWPIDLLPAPADASVSVRGLSGATVEEVLPLIAEVLQDSSSSRTLQQSITIIFCAGENDISQSILLADTLISFRRLLEMVFPPLTSNSTKSDPTIKKNLIVLGPKFEPWLEYDAGCRKQYFKMSHAMERACKKKVELADQNKNTIIYVDCLTMFCGESGKVPGAVLGGKAMPDKKLFDYDQLHLSREGYKIWKLVVEEHLTKLLQGKVLSEEEG
ncbi:expressed unknown protein [Seminavis robusta]|uniref:SGNH hydrolase-type esterase domain-containing protein n=1 Tax=Seminavis robusta TaxID=568900 RepID=A0A9N8HGF5_9STRA|nr:expressed unknown protein [Seminavis robusta]|eukprot:Sro395_g133960.1 n/a (235) ;mRNA; f:5096-5800